MLQDRLAVRPQDRPAPRRQRGSRTPLWRARPGYRSSMVPRPCPAMAASMGASWMEAKAFTCRVRIKARAASTAAISAAGTITDTFCWSPMTRAAVTENTNTPTARPNVRQTIGSSRNRFSRGDRLVKAHCTTRKSSEKMTVTSPRTPKPTATSVSVTRVLATVESRVILGSSRPRTSPASAHSSCTRPARSRRRGRANRPRGEAASGRITPPRRGRAGTPSANVSSSLPLVCQFAGIRVGSAMRLRGPPRAGPDLWSSVASLRLFFFPVGAGGGGG